MIIHTLEKEKHSDFLEQNRIDPITGDILQEGDEIVICASCKSAFLVDSWEYMNDKHCEQSLTLKEVPISEVVRIERPYLIDLNEIKVASRYGEAIFSATPYFLITGIFCAILYYFSFFSNRTEAMQITNWSVIIMTAIFYFKSSYKNKLEITNHILFFDKKKNSENSLKIEEIKEVKVYKSKRHTFMNAIKGLFSSKNQAYTLEITDKHEIKYNFLLEHKELERISKETNLLQKFHKNSLSFLSVNSKSIEIAE
ncbi:hypothetical protein [Bernardetia sp. MNP-M8]|uniref:hypothetical protein n=1 Tax=Bernardetia sp. MNP-M8 TaxID=3127470 RepID=UPI0030D1EDB7